MCNEREKKFVYKRENEKPINNHAYTQQRAGIKNIERYRGAHE
jgi:hypothetical protein